MSRLKIGFDSDLSMLLKIQDKNKKKQPKSNKQFEEQKKTIWIPNFNG